MTEKYRRLLFTISRNGDAIRDASIAANFARRHRSFLVSHAGLNGKLGGTIVGFERDHPSRREIRRGNRECLRTSAARKL